MKSASSLVSVSSVVNDLSADQGRTPEELPSGGLLGLFAVAALALLLALVGTRHLPLIDRDEGRYAEGAREMLASGDWLVPRLFGVPYLEKPPLFYWLTAAAYHMVGVDELGARLVSALAATAGVLATGLFARRSFGARAALFAAAILATSGLYFVLARVAITDMLFAVLIAGAIMAFYAAESEGRSFLPFWVLAAAATLTKGPVAPVLCALVGAAHVAIAGRWAVLRARRFWSGLPLFLALVVPWFAWVEIDHPGFLGFYVYKEHMLRVAGDEHREPFYWYVPWLLLCFLPWTPLFIATLPRIRIRLQERSRGGAAARFTAVWAALILAFFSLPRGKLVPYILPMFPALAILLGDALDRWIGADDTGRAVPRAFACIALALLAGLGALPVGVHYSPAEIPAGLVLLVAAGMLGAGVTTLYLARSRSWKPIAAVAGSVAALECAAIVVAAPIASYLTTYPVIQLLRARLGPDDPVVLFSGYFPNLPFYLQRIPYFVVGNRELDFGVSLDGPGPWIVESFDALKERIGNKRLLIVLRTRESELQRLLNLPGEARLLHRGRTSSLIEYRP
ncbi:MAG TPA: glycosyltransferase family 39 protein [Candidatus Binatia bacterium]|nr:glycosyltransferase family 39 protein [Candidatus Binatia bacterium]